MKSAAVAESARMRPRRFAAFSLRTLFVVLTISCGCLGWKVERVRNQREVVQQLQQLGGRAVYDWQPKYVAGDALNGRRSLFIGFRRSIRQPPEPPGPKWLRHLIGDEYFQEIEQVAFLMAAPNIEPVQADECRLWIPLLKRLPDLRMLVIVRPVSDESLGALREALPRCEVFAEADIGWAM